MKDPYEILGVTNRSSQSEIKEAYRRLAQITHPDKGGTATRFIEIKKAYDTLKNHAIKVVEDIPSEFEGVSSEWKRQERDRTKNAFEQGL